VDKDIVIPCDVARGDTSFYQQSGGNVLNSEQILDPSDILEHLVVTCSATSRGELRLHRADSRNGQTSKSNGYSMQRARIGGRSGKNV
jgi:hypothetical protein